MKKEEINEILIIAKKRLKKGDVPVYSAKFSEDICALIYGIAEYKRISNLHFTWIDAINIFGEIFQKEVKTKNILIEKEILRIVPKNFSLNNLLNMVMKNE